jgi:hypothetical protein
MGVGQERVGVLQECLLFLRRQKPYFVENGFFQGHGTLLLLCRRPNQMKCALTLGTLVNPVLGFR